MLTVCAARVPLRRDRARGAPLALLLPFVSYFVVSLLPGVRRAAPRAAAAADLRGVGRSPREPAAARARGRSATPARRCWRSPSSTSTAPPCTSTCACSRLALRGGGLDRASTCRRASRSRPSRAGLPAAGRSHGLRRPLVRDRRHPARDPRRRRRRVGDLDLPAAIPTRIAATSTRLRAGRLGYEVAYVAEGRVHLLRWLDTFRAPGAVSPPIYVLHKRAQRPGTEKR